MRDEKKEFEDKIQEDKDSGVKIEIEDGSEAAGEAPEEEKNQEDVLEDGNNPQAIDSDPEEAAEEEAAEEEEAGEEDQEGKGKLSFLKKKKGKSARLLEKELAKAETVAADLTDRYQRLMAEFENARKRMDKEKGQMYDMGAKAVLEKLLPVVDNFERGLGSLSEEAKQDPFVEGMDKVYQQMMTVLTDLGVSPIDAVNQEFNPDLHNAVMHVEDEELGDNVVAEEFQKGYKYKDSVLRYSMVKVAN